MKVSTNVKAGLSWEGSKKTFLPVRTGILPGVTLLPEARMKPEWKRILGEAGAGLPPRRTSIA